VSVPRSCATATLLTLVTTKPFDSVLALKSSGFAGALFGVPSMIDCLEVKVLYPA
jgi:hypothetical protein